MNPHGHLQVEGASTTESTVDVFVSFDVERDGDLYELLREQSGSPGSGFAVSDGSCCSAATDLGSETLRGRIREADQVIVICGENTKESVRVCAELTIAKEERTPYFLLWGRREIMCTKPVGAKTDEGMYSWTSEVLESQIALTIRRGRKPPARITETHSSAS